VEYQPSLLEWQITAGIWALGLMVYSVALKIAIPVMSGEVNFAERTMKRAARAAQ
jgi:molybdopterin-containing oxidoreductase family membrane subunit